MEEAVVAANEIADVVAKEVAVDVAASVDAEAEALEVVAVTIVGGFG